jgi:PAS domain S-box-containing protein
MATADLDGNITDVNRAFLDLWGYDDEKQVVGRPAAAMWQLPDRAEEVVLALEVAGSWNGSLTAAKRDGGSFVAEVSASIVRDERGDPFGMVASFADVSRHRSTEEELRVSQASFANVVSSSPMGIHMYELAPDGRLIFTGANPAADRILGVDNSRYVGLTIEEAFPPLVQTEVPSAYTSVAAGGGTWNTEQVDYEDEEIRGAFEVYAFQTGPGSMAAMFLDITDRKRAEAERARLEEELQRALRRERDTLASEVATLRAEVSHRYNLGNLVGQDDKMVRIFETILTVAPTEVTVLIEGETGTGKELVARAIHSHSPRKEKPFVVVDCGALSATLLESELFGHAKGAFTGAVGDRPGRFEVAAGGTVFLDEIHNLSFELQAKLLRVVEDGTFERVGDSSPMKADVRIVAATNEDLARLIESRRFRHDLYYRLRVVPIALPPLRERKGDIPLLVEHLIGRLAPRHGSKSRDISRGALEKLTGYHWPGNVRELANVVERALVLSKGGTIRAADVLLSDVSLDEGRSPPAPGSPLETSVRDAEMRAVKEALENAGGNRKRAAELLGVSRSTFYAKLKKHGIA